MAPELSGGRGRHSDRNPGPSHFLAALGPTETTESRVTLSGSWRSDEVVVIEVGNTSVVYLGCCLAKRHALQSRAVHALGSGHLAELTEFPGSFHVLVSSPNMFAAFGDVVGLRQVFYAPVGKSLLVSDRADVVARRVGASLKDEWLALWLVWPPPELWPPESPWEGVTPVPPGNYLTWRRDDPRLQVEPYWVPPTPDVPLQEGAPLFAEALSTAVRGRVRQAVSPSCDLSGGKDTTPIAFLADSAAGADDSGVDRHHGRILAITLPSVSPDNDDARWALAVAENLEAVDHLMVPATECPLPYDDLGVAMQTPDHPSVGMTHSARHRRLASRLVQVGCGDDHFSGDGGDEVLEATPAYIRSLLPRHPRFAAKRLRRHCALTGVPVRSAARRVLWPGSYGRWLEKTAASLNTGLSNRQAAAHFGWGVLPPVAPWLTDHAIHLAARVLERAGANATPRAHGMAHHATLARIHAGAATVRLHQQFMAGLGVRLHSPYFDRYVAESAVTVRPHERTDPSTFKPLLDAATTSTVPERFRARITKGHYTDDIAWGLFRNRNRIASLITDARLVERGLIDGGIAHRAVQSVRGPEGLVLALCDMLSCERWIRSVEEPVS